MRNLLLGVAVATFCIVVTASAALAQAPPPVEAFGRLPAVADAEISPDGSKIALLTSNEAGARSVTVATLDNSAPPRSWPMNGEVRLISVGWADDAHVSFLVSQAYRPGQLEGVHIVGNPENFNYYRNGAIDLQSGQIAILTTDNHDTWADTGSRLVAPIAGDPGFARLIGRDANLQRLSVYRVDLANGRSRILTPQGTNSDTIDFLLDADGNPLARTDVHEHSNHWRIFVYDGATPRLLGEGDSPTGVPTEFVRGLLPDGRLAVFKDNDAGMTVLHAVDRTSGASEEFAAKEGADVGSVIIDHWTRRVVGIGWTGAESQQEFFEPDLQAAQRQIYAWMPNAAVHIAMWSRDRSHFLVYVEQGLDGGAYYVYDVRAPRATMVGQLYPQLYTADVGERQSITYRARDGTRIPAYLTLPPTQQRTGLPLVLLVHGGPHGVRDTLDFDWWAAFLASRGYAVLQPNYRGSGGYGTQWQEAGYHQWGGLMQTDVEDGVTALIRNGIVDAARVCIVGASYGGYAALAGASLTPDRYRCAVSVAGVSDLFEMLSEASSEGRRGFAEDWWRQSIGDPNTDRARLRATSPLYLVNQIHIPILLMHGSDDSLVPVQQSWQMRDALSAAGKSVRYVSLQGDDHHLSYAPTRIQMLRELESFLAENIGPEAAH